MPLTPSVSYSAKKASRSPPKCSPITKKPLTPEPERQFVLPVTPRDRCAVCAQGMAPCRKHSFLGGGKFGKVYLGTRKDGGKGNESDDADTCSVSSDSSILTSSSSFSGGSLNSTGSLSSSSSPDKVAMKVLSHKGVLGTTKSREIQREISIMTLVTQQIVSKCANLVPLLDVYYDRDSTTLVMPCLSDDLLTMCESRRFSQVQARAALAQLLGAIAALHEHNICHLDVKAENLAYSNSEEGLDKLVLFDFGFALEQEVWPVNIPGPIFGTKRYLAPEVFLSKEYGPAADVWAAGCVFFVLLCHHFPFRNSPYSCRGQWERTSPEVDQLSSTCVDLIETFFTVNPRDRLSAREMLNHPFFQDELELETVETMEAAEVASRQDHTQCRCW